MTKDEEVGIELISKLGSVQHATMEDIVVIAKDMVEKYPQLFGKSEGRPCIASLREKFIKCLISLGVSRNNIRYATGCKLDTISKYRREMEIEKAEKNKSLSDLEKFPHLKSTEILNDFNNYLSTKLKNNIETLTERLAEKLDDEDTLHKTSIRDLAISTTIMTDTYRKTTNQDKQIVDVNHNIHLFPDSPINILKNYKPKEVITDGKVIEDLPHVDPIMEELPPEDFKDE